jgi:hypothetical protein
LKKIDRLKIEEVDEDDPEWLPKGEQRWIVPVPVGEANLSIYKVIVNHLKARKNEWVELKNLRRLFSDQKFNICLHDVKKVSGSKGLLWRQQAGKGTVIEYCWGNY